MLLGVASWPGSHEDSIRVVSFHPYSPALAALAAIVRETADSALNEAMAATQESESITARLEALTPIDLPANLWLPAPSSN